MSKRPNIECPKCLQLVDVSIDQAGSRVSCSNCGESLVVPESLKSENAFDDLFDEETDQPDESEKPGHSPESPWDSENQNEVEHGIEEASMTMGDQADFDTRWIDELETFSTDDKPEKTEKPDTPKQPQEDSSQTQAADETDPHKDPFEYEETKALRIDGISPDIADSDGFLVKCSVCDSKLHATNHQIGQKVQCTDCLSEIIITKPKKKAKFKNDWQRPAAFKDPTSDDDLTLEPPVDLPKVPVQEGFGLEEVQQDLLSPLVEAEVVTPAQSPKKRTVANKRKAPKPAEPTKPTYQDENDEMDEHESMPAYKSPIIKTASGAKATKRAKRAQDAAGRANISLSKQLGELNLASDIELIIRSIVVVVFLAFGYAMLSSVWGTLQREDINGGEKFVQFFPAAIGAAVCLLISAWFLSITFSVLMRSIASGSKNVEEWVGFAPSEWFGSFVVVAFSAWAATLPGVLVGYFAWSVTNFFILLPLCAAISSFLLIPVFLISALENESAINIFSTKTLDSLTQHSDLWLQAFKTFGLCLAVFAAGTLLLLIPMMLFSLIGAAVQVASVILFAVLLGLHMKNLTKLTADLAEAS